MGFSTYADLLSKMASAGTTQRPFTKAAPSAFEAAGVWHSYWSVAGDPAAGATPATTPGTAYSNDAGGIVFPAEASDTKHLVSFGLSFNSSSTAESNCVMLYDRLVAVSGISLASTGSVTINSAALPRYSGTAAVNVQAWLEITTATTVTAPIVNLDSYTNQAGTAGRVGGSYTFPAAATEAGTMIGPLPIQAGDSGIRSVEAGLNVGTAASAGVCNLVLLRPLAYVQTPAQGWAERDLVLQLAALPRIYDGATLALMAMATGTQGRSLAGSVLVARG